MILAARGGEGRGVGRGAAVAAHPDSASTGLSGPSALRRRRGASRLAIAFSPQPGKARLPKINVSIKLRVETGQIGQLLSVRQ